MPSTIRDSRIALVIVWLGPWPPWFPAFVHSCRLNAGIDWLIVTDAPPPSDPPPNVKFVAITLQGFNRLATERLGFPVAITHAYKLIDFKPLCRFLFREHLTGYDFWGHCDLDIVWGRIRHFIDDSILTEHDVISARKNKMCGHFSLFRNDPRINELFRAHPTFKEQLSHSASVAFDEIGMTSVIERAAREGKVRVYWPKFLLNFANPGNEHPSRLDPMSRMWRWSNGVLFDRTGGDEKEIMYLHFMTWKKTLTRCDFGHGNRPSSFYISYDGIEVIDAEEQRT